MQEKMKAANLHAVMDLRYEDIDKPKCEKGEVLVALKSCGVCGSDVPRVYTKGTYHFPTVIGHEFSGLVVEDESGEWLGKRVAVFPLLPCFECESCKAQNYATCSNYDYYGSRRDGGMAEFLAVKRWNLIELPEGLSYDEAAMCEPVSVGHHAIGKLGMKEGETLLVSGAGPIGIIAGQWARLSGAKDVYYFDIDARKIDFAEEMGFKAYTGEEKIDCVLEGTGHSAALAKCLAAIKPFGRMVLMGNPAGEVTLSQDTYWHILRKELKVYGTWNSSYSEMQNDWKESLKAIAEGKLNVKPLITHKFPLERVDEAFALMHERKEFFNKVMLNMNED